METKKGTFAEKGQSILNPQKPKGISDFLDENKDVSVRKTANTECRKAVREEFRLPFELAERLRKYAYKNRSTKTATVIEALSKFFSEERAK